MTPTVIVTGMHSGANPSPGLGVARSIRAARPDIRIIGLDYSPLSTGMHSDAIDDRVLLPKWSEIQVGTWASQLREMLREEDSLLIPNLDLEVHLLAHELPDSVSILAPSTHALALVAKPPATAAEILGLALPKSAAAGDWNEIERVVHSSPYGVWVKGAYYEAFRASTTREVEVISGVLTERWGPAWYVESHTPGQECSIVFSAWRGRLIDCAYMEKSSLTAEGKTWSGHITEIPPPLLEPLRRFVSKAQWTGGGEIEMIKTWENAHVLMEINPRFPAWVNGATICGVNLPAALVEAALSGEVRRAVLEDEFASPRIRAGAGFVRVVQEIPVAPEVGLPTPAWSPSDSGIAATKHPSDMPGLRRSVLAGHPVVEPSHDAHPGFDRETSVHVPIAHEYAELLGAPPDAQTPVRIVLPHLFRLQHDRLRHALMPVANIRLAYSIKTCPDPMLMRIADDMGMVPEAITLAELDLARTSGMSVEHAILNGPAKFWPPQDSLDCSALFVDSLEELDYILSALEAGHDLRVGILGIRVAPSWLGSRFGIALDKVGVLRATGELLARIIPQIGAGWGLQFHHAATVLTAPRWVSECAAAFALAEPLVELLGIAPAAIDLGGGWGVADWAAAGESIEQVVRDLPDAFGKPPLVVVEAGKLLTQPAGVIVTKVIGRRGTDLVLDASIAEVPEAPHWPHPTARYRGNSWHVLHSGQGRLLGRSCMEQDVLASRVATDDVVVGDHIAIGMCGAYDRSMSYRFASGQFGGV